MTKNIRDFHSKRGRQKPKHKLATIGNRIFGREVAEKYLHQLYSELAGNRTRRVQRTQLPLFYLGWMELKMLESLKLTRGKKRKANKIHKKKSKKQAKTQNLKKNKKLNERKIRDQKMREQQRKREKIKKLKQEQQKKKQERIRQK